MDTADLPLSQSPDEQRLSFELFKKLLALLDQWGKAQGGAGSAVLDRVVLDSLLQAVTAICVSKELSSMGITPAETQAFFRRIYKGEGLVKAEESEVLLRLQARKDVLLTALRRAVSTFPEGSTATATPEEDRSATPAKQQGEIVGLEHAEVYADHRIHPTLLPSGSWIVSVVRIGTLQEGPRGMGSRVERLRGEYPSEVQAVLAAKRYIDQRPEGQADGL